MECYKCKADKPEEEFSRRTKSKRGYSDWCKLCQHNYHKQYYSESKDVIKEYKRKIESKIKVYNEVYMPQYYLTHKDKLKLNSKRYQIENKNKLFDKKQSYAKNYYLSHKKEKVNYQKQYKLKNPGYMTNYVKERSKVDINFKIHKILRSRFKAIFKNKIKHTSVINLIGCSLNDLKLHLEAQFKPEMNWQNHGKIWEIDHIIPCSKFNFIELEEQQKCFHYTNLQPLFKTTSIAKELGYKDHIGNRNKKNKYNES